MQQLWTWHNGWVDSPDGDPFWFRDNWLTGTPEVEDLMNLINGYAYDGMQVDITRCVPTAQFNGSTYAVSASSPITPARPPTSRHFVL